MKLLQKFDTTFLRHSVHTCTCRSYVIYSIVAKLMCHLLLYHRFRCLILVATDTQSLALEGLPICIFAASSDSVCWIVRLITNATSYSSRWGRCRILMQPSWWLIHAGLVFSVYEADKHPASTPPDGHNFTAVRKMLRAMTSDHATGNEISEKRSNSPAGGCEFAMAIVYV